MIVPLLPACGRPAAGSGSAPRTSILKASRSLRQSPPDSRQDFPRPPTRSSTIHVLLLGATTTLGMLLTYVIPVLLPLCGRCARRRAGNRCVAAGSHPVPAHCSCVSRPALDRFLPSRYRAVLSRRHAGIRCPILDRPRGPVERPRAGCRNALSPHRPPGLSQEIHGWYLYLLAVLRAKVHLLQFRLGRDAKAVGSTVS